MNMQLKISTNQHFINDTDYNHLHIKQSIKDAWQVIAPFWPLKNLIAVNPLQGFENLPFEEALVDSARYFQNKDFPPALIAINRETIKWCQAYFDEGQATIAMPNRQLGFYNAIRSLAKYDDCLTHPNQFNQKWFEQLPDSPEEAIILFLQYLKIPASDTKQFFTLLLSTLPGWAGFVKYFTDWQLVKRDGISVTPADFLAVRLMITCLLWPTANELLAWYHQSFDKINVNQINSITHLEKQYRNKLISTIANQSNFSARPNKVIAQWVFCIDVRSEPMRRAIEAQGDYETFGYAGFFGLPVQIINHLNGETYPSCPVLVKPQHLIDEVANCSAEQCQKLREDTHRIGQIRKLYQSLKYAFTTPFVLAEGLGIWAGLWMFAKTFFPRFIISQKRKKITRESELNHITAPILEQTDTNNHGIGFAQQCNYAETTLKMIGLVDNFSPLVILCGHGSSTQNNAFASALDCGACGGRPGAINAKILATILNSEQVREHLKRQGIIIPFSTKFIAALHDTTTDKIELYPEKSITIESTLLQKITNDLTAARYMNTQKRCQQLQQDNRFAIQHVEQRSQDWSEVRPEWGLARNAAFIVGPREMTKKIDLEGRTFLHSYDWQLDKEGQYLTTILTAPMIVAQWINSQYLFSSLDNAAYGSGSKITQNITGKIGVMQGNASDLMHGLPLQSVHVSDSNAYHEPVRLCTIVFAPKDSLLVIVQKEAILKKLFSNGWVNLICIDPNENKFYSLNRNLNWEPVAL